MSESKEVRHVIVKVNQSSFEFGPAKKRHKVYYEDADDLKNKLEQLKVVLQERRDTIDFLTGDDL